MCGGGKRWSQKDQIVMVLLSPQAPSKAFMQGTAGPGLSSVKEWAGSAHLLPPLAFWNILFVMGGGGGWWESWKLGWLPSYHTQQPSLSPANQWPFLFPLALPLGWVGPTAGTCCRPT